MSDAFVTHCITCAEATARAEAAEAQCEQWERLHAENCEAYDRACADRDMLLDRMGHAYEQMLVRSVEEATARAEAAESRLREWQECALYDATMDGPVLRGWDRSGLERCRKKALGGEHER